MKTILVLLFVATSFELIYGDDAKPKEKVSFDKLQPETSAGNEV